VFCSEAPDVRWVGEILCAIVEDVSVVSERKLATFGQNAKAGISSFKVKKTDF